MSILSPTSLETIDYGQQFWQAVFNSNVQRENAIFTKLSGFWDGTATDGQVPVWNNASSKVIPSAAPYPVPQAAVAATIGTTTTINATTSKFFTLSLTMNTTLSFSNFSNGMYFDLVLTQDATGGRTVTTTGMTLVGSISMVASMNTWLKCYKVGTTTFLEVRGTFAS